MSNIAILMGEYGGASVVYSTWDPASIGPHMVLSSGNQVCTYTGIADSMRASVKGTQSNQSGKRQFEIAATGNAIMMIAIGTASATKNDYPGHDANARAYYGSNGNKYVSNAGTAYGATYISSDIIGVVFDDSTGTLTFYKNGTSQGTAYTGLATTGWFPMWGEASDSYTQSATLRTGAAGFTYPVSGASAWG